MQVLFLPTRGKRSLILKGVHNWCTRAHRLTFPSAWRRQVVRAKARARADILVRPSRKSLEDRRRRLGVLKATTDCRVCGLKGHRPHGRDCAMSQSSSASQIQLVWRHNNIFPTQRTKLKCVLFSTTTVMIRAHLRLWLVKMYLYQRNQSNRHRLNSTASAAVDTKKGGILDVSRHG